MAEHSQNGWPVLSSNRLIWFSAAGGRFAAASSDVAFLARYLIDRFDKEVEKVDGRVLDDWSWADRTVRGSRTISNHASATAWDLNALKHPQGARGTFTRAQVNKVHAILASITDGRGHKIFRWGNDYVSATIDAMHFEINASKAQVKRARAVVQQRLEDEADMKWTDQIKLTATDAKIWKGGYKAGDKVTFGLMVRYPTLARKTQTDLAAFAAASAKRDAAMKAQLDTLIKAVGALSAGSAAEVTKAFEEGLSALRAEVDRVDAEATALSASGVSDEEIAADVEAAIAAAEAEEQALDLAQAERANSTS